MSSTSAGFLRSFSRKPITATMSSRWMIFSVSGEERPSLVLSLSRPTREKSYFCALRNMPSNRLREESSVGGSPGRMRR